MAPQTLRFAYKRARYSDRSFSHGLFDFPFRPFLYELVRMIDTDDLDYETLSAPVWLVGGGIYGMLCQSPACICRSIHLADPHYIIRMRSSNFAKLFCRALTVMLNQFPNGFSREVVTAFPSIREIRIIAASSDLNANCASAVKESPTFSTLPGKIEISRITS